MDLSRRHMRFGWWALLVFAASGLVLEGLHGFKVAAYLNVSSEARRLQWTLAHAHGALLSIINLVFGLGLRLMPESRGRSEALISSCLIGATILLPGGFFLGGLVTYGGDPGLGALLVPAGAMLLLLALFFIARTSSAIGHAETARRKKKEEDKTK